jgi:preprotein translocase subunit SecF
MKTVLLPALVLLLAITGCSSFRPGTKYSIDAVTVIRVEYRYAPSAEQMIRQVLRLKRVSDWEVIRDGSEETIKARYKELPAGIAADMEERLRQIPEVLDIEIKKDGVPVRNE